MTEVLTSIDPPLALFEHVLVKALQILIMALLYSHLL